MIAADTNVLLRLTVNDDPSQTNAAEGRLRKALESRAEIYINPVVLAEFVWTLARTYGAKRAEQTDAVRQYFDRPPYRLFDEPTVRAALELFESSRAGFSDCLIAALNGASGVETTFTFDRAAASLPNFASILES